MAESLGKFPHEVRQLPVNEVFLLLAYYKHKGKTERNELDLEDVSTNDLQNMFGA